MIAPSPGGTATGAAAIETLDFLPPKLAAAPASESAAISAAESEPEPESEPDPGKKLLLLIENDPAMKAGVRAALPADTWTMRSCADGKQAVETALRLRPAVVASRRDPPGESGVEITRAVKAERGLAGTRCIIIVNEYDTLDEFQAQMAGVDKVLHVPATTEEWQRALEP